MPVTFLERRQQLRQRYRREPGMAWTTHLAWVESSGDDAVSPARGTVHVGLGGEELPFALDESVGGEDEVAPGDILCAALAACIDSTIRVTAACMGLAIVRLSVIATGDVDARGALGDAEVPVGFQSLRIEIELRLPPGGAAGAAERLLARAERGCVLLQTLRSGLAIEMSVDAA